MIETEPEDLVERRALVALSLVPGVGPARIRALVRSLGSAAAVLAAPERALARVPGVGPQTAAAVARFDADGLVDEQLRRAEGAGAELVSLWSPVYPRLLAEIYDPPVVLWVRGTLRPEDERAVAIVGTRRATGYGQRVAYEFAAELARRGYTVVSGLAYGIDTAAHRGALEAGGRTIAVLGSGVDRVYPASNLRLARRIVEQGALVSEYALGAAPDAPNFPRRNRIISGLSRGTLVAEAFETGGALITAHLALEQNREVFAAPVSLYSEAGQGANGLIRQGHAKLVTGVDDLLVEFGEEQAVAPAPEPAQLNPVERRLLEALDARPIQIDRLCLETGLDASTALVWLLSLEFKGLVRQLAGKQFRRA